MRRCIINAEHADLFLDHLLAGKLTAPETLPLTVQVLHLLLASGRIASCPDGTSTACLDCRELRLRLNPEYL
jgi:hypothetical protein